jgi:hypothetical protein
MNNWKSVFSNSPVNEGCYDETLLPDFHWQWPKGTWFQARLDYARDHGLLARMKNNKTLPGDAVDWEQLKLQNADSTARQSTASSTPRRRVAKSANPTKQSRPRSKQTRRIKTATQKKPIPTPICAS